MKKYIKSSAIKIIIILLLFSNKVISEESFQSNQLSAGIITGVKSSLYKSQKKDLFIFPIIQFSYKNLYLKGTELGIKINKKPMLIYFDYIMNGYKSNDIFFLNGMKDRKNSIHLGIQYDCHLKEYNFSVTPKISFDISNRNKGFIFGLDSTKIIFLNKKSILIPQISINYLNSEFANYYYGVEQGEMSTYRNNYKVPGVFIPSLSLIYSYNITNKLSCNILSGFEYLTDKISNSPIIDTKCTIKLMFNINYVLFK
ncbi:MipA/OmpV family protein [Candidatus Dependentiae bacterium]|nr:MipA/OmpV family protein [Candidatus Dependentiae bacterium]